jgi:hypothetical protein
MFWQTALYWTSSPSPTDTACASAGAAAASTMANMAANSITFLTLYLLCLKIYLYMPHFFISSRRCQHHIPYFFDFLQLS